MWSYEIFDIKAPILFLAFGAVLLSMVGTFLKSKKGIACSVILLLISNALLVVEGASGSWITLLIVCDSLLLAVVGNYTKEKVYLWCGAALMVIASVAAYRFWF